jgi:hypothetical protein
MTLREVELEQENAFLKSELERYKAMFKLANRDRFGSKSERVVDLPAEQLIFNEIEKEAPMRKQAPLETQIHPTLAGRI